MKLAQLANVLALGLAPLAAGCSEPGVCDSFAGRACITVRVTSEDAEMRIQQMHIESDELSVYADTPPSPSGTDTLPEGALPLELAVVPAKGFLGPFLLRGQGRRGGEVLGEGAVSGTISERDEHITVDLRMVATEAPRDFACLDQLGQLEPWTRAEPYIAECGSRAVMVLQELGPIVPPSSLSLARSPSGELAIAVDKPTSFESGDLVFARFTEPATSSDAIDLSIETFPGGDFTLVGAASALASDVTGKFHLAYSDFDGSTTTVRYRTLPGLPGDAGE